MIIKDVKAMITYSFSYADEIGWKKNGTYPLDAKITLRNQLKDDLLVFMGFLFDEDSCDLDEQVNFINDSLQIVITPENFKRLIDDKCSPEQVLRQAPLSLQYFVRDDTSPYSRRVGYGIALSKYLVNTFNDVGCYFIAFGGISEKEADRLNQYISMMNEYLDMSGLNDRMSNDERMRIRQAQEMRSREGRAFADSMIKSYNSKRSSGMGSLLFGKSFGNFSNGYSSRNAMQERPYTTSQAEADAMRMMFEYNAAHADKGTNFDTNMLMRTPTGNVDRSMVVGRDGETQSVPAGPVTPAGPTGMMGPNGPIGPGQSGAKETKKRGPIDQAKLDELLAQLDDLIGLQSVKQSLRNLINLVKVNKMREEMGLKTPSMSLHLVFSGNPGTGKTTVARLLAKIYHLLGVVSKGQFVEVDRSGLVEGYVGQTATKTSKVCDEALGGILFIDEAYTLTNADGQDFGQEAVDTLLKRMEDNRDDFIVIVAGYTNEMKDFINSNPGLKSRFNKFIEFPDYTGDELYEIYDLMCNSQDYVMNSEAEDYVRRHLKMMPLLCEDNFANAREVRNYFERCVERQATRVVSEENIDAYALTTFKIEDVSEE